MISRNTVQRQIVLGAVRSMTNHPTAEEIYNHIVKNHPTISKGTVYRNLNLLAEQGEVLRVRIPDGADRYDLRSRPHYHIRCTGCGQVFDVDMPYQEDLSQKVNDSHGFLFTGHDIVFTGVCPDCRQQGEEAPCRI